MSSDRKMPDDRELEDFLAGLHPVGKAYREASKDEGAPPELDAAILTAAREAVRTPRARRPRWFQPVAVAATLALSLGVLLNIWRDPETREQMAPAESPDLDRMKAQALEERTPSAVVETKKEAGPSTTAPSEPAADAEAPAAVQSAPGRGIEAEIERRSDAVAARRESKSLQREEPLKAKEGATMNSADAELSAGAAAPKAEAPMMAPKPKSGKIGAAARSVEVRPCGVGGFVRIRSRAAGSSAAATARTGHRSFPRCSACRSARSGRQSHVRRPCRTSAARRIEGRRARP